MNQKASQPTVEAMIVPARTYVRILNLLDQLPHGQVKGLVNELESESRPIMERPPVPPPADPPAAPADPPLPGEETPPLAAVNGSPGAQVELPDADMAGEEPTGQVVETGPKEGS